MNEPKINQETEITDIPDIQAVTPEQVVEFRQNALNDLMDLYTSKQELIDEVESNFYKMLIENKFSFVEVGKIIKTEYDKLWFSTMRSLKKDKVYTIEHYNILVASLLSLIAPIPEFLESDEKRKEGLQHVMFIKAALRSIPIRFHGCVDAWKKEDLKLKESSHD